MNVRKVCKACNIEKVLDDYYRIMTSFNEKDSICKECRKKQSKTRYENPPSSSLCPVGLLRSLPKGDQNGMEGKGKVVKPAILCPEKQSLFTSYPKDRMENGRKVGTQRAEGKRDELLRYRMVRNKKELNELPNELLIKVMQHMLIHHAVKFGRVSRKVHAVFETHKRDVLRKQFMIKKPTLEYMRTAVKNGFFHIIQYLFEEKKRFDLKEYQFVTVLIECIEYQQHTILKYLIDHGVSVNLGISYDEYNFLTPLASAACLEDFDMVDYLLNKGANIHAYRDTALTETIVKGSLKMINYLISKGADMNKVDVKFLLFKKNEYISHIREIALGMNLNPDYELKRVIANREYRPKGDPVVINGTQLDNKSMSFLVDEFIGKCYNLKNLNTRIKYIEATRLHPNNQFIKLIVKEENRV